MIRLYQIAYLTHFTQMDNKNVIKLILISIVIMCILFVLTIIVNIFTLSKVGNIDTNVNKYCNIDNSLKFQNGWPR